MPTIETHPLDELTNQVERLLHDVELASWARIAAWAEESSLSLEDIRVLLVLAAHDGPTAGAVEVTELSGLSLDAAYPALRRLCARGLSYEEHRRYALTEAGERAVAAVDGARRAGIRAYLADLPDHERVSLESSVRPPRRATDRASA